MDTERKNRRILFLGASIIKYLFHDFSDERFTIIGISGWNLSGFSHGIMQSKVIEFSKQIKPNEEVFICLQISGNLIAPGRTFFEQRTDQFGRPIPNSKRRPHYHRSCPPSSPAEAESKYLEFLTFLRKNLPGCKIFIIPPFPRRHFAKVHQCFNCLFYPPSHFRRYTQHFSLVFDSKNCKTLFWSDICNPEKLDICNLPSHFFIQDGIHINSTGCRTLRDILVKYFQQNLLLEE